MLHALALEHSDREIWWLHGARSGREHSVRRRGPRAPRRAPERAHPRLLQPPGAGPTSKAATSTRRAGSRPPLLAELAAPRDAEAYLCGPAAFMDEISAGLAAIGVDAARIHTEPFGPAPGLTPGIAATPARPPHPPAGAPGDGPAIEFARSDLAVPLERATTRACSSSPRPATSPSAGRAAPASATPARRRSSRATVDYSPDPVEPPADGQRADLLRAAAATTSCSTSSARDHGLWAVQGSNL